jgi:FkbH-like protein
MNSLSLALLASSSLPGFSGMLRRSLALSGYDAAIWEASFNQYRQEFANPASGLYSSRPEVVILHLDGEDLFADCLRRPFDAGPKDRAERARQAAAEIASLLQLVRVGLPDALVLLNTVYLPPLHALSGLEHHSPWGVSDLAAQFNVELAAIAAAQPNVLVHDVAALVMDMGYRQWFDPRLWHLARCRLGNAAMKRLVRSVASLLRAWKGQSRKCIVLDLDHTLWGGIVGEDGPAGLTLAEEGPGLAFAEFQEELAHLGHKGVLLAICSKNNEEDALEVLRRHPSMRLREDSFAARRINWQDKAQNIRELAAELNLGLDSFVFIDDNPAERSLVRQSLPEVLVPEWPQEPSHYRAALLELAAEHFGRVTVTSEDRERTALYRAERERVSLAASAGSLADYYRSLDMHVHIAPADTFSIPRIAQLTQKTNQFNLTTRRYTEAAVRSLAEQADAVVLWLHLRDRFADQGIVGVLIVKQESPAAWGIDTFLLSCRVIGRGVEKAFLGFTAEMLLERGVRSLSGEYLPTPKNGLAANVYRDCGFELLAENQGATRWSLNLETQALPIPGWIVVESTQEKTSYVG